MCVRVHNLEEKERESLLDPLDSISEMRDWRERKEKRISLPPRSPALPFSIFVLVFFFPFGGFSFFSVALQKETLPYPSISIPPAKLARCCFERRGKSQRRELAQSHGNTSNGLFFFFSSAIREEEKEEKKSLCVFRTRKEMCARTNVQGRERERKCPSMLNE